MADWLFPHLGWKWCLIGMCLCFIAGLAIILYLEYQNEERR